MCNAYVHSDGDPDLQIELTSGQIIGTFLTIIGVLIIIGKGNLSVLLGLQVTMW